jgi:hypothetical protein
MSRGRSPEGETALSNAERQARCHKQAPVVVVQSPDPTAGFEEAAARHGCE